MILTAIETGALSADANTVNHGQRALKTTKTDGHLDGEVFTLVNFRGYLILHNLPTSSISVSP